MIKRYFNKIRKELKNRTFRIFLIYVAVSTILSVNILGSQFSILMLAWYSISIFTYLSVSENKNQILLASVVYPFIELTLKIMLNYNIIPYSWVLINRSEHSFFSILAIYMIFNAVFPQNLFKKYNLIFSLLLAFLLLNLFGIINEFMEFYIREFMLHIPKEKYLTLFAGYYSDTIYDLFTNLIASAVMCVIIFLNYFKASKKTA